MTVWPTFCAIHSRSTGSNSWLDCARAFAFLSCDRRASSYSMFPVGTLSIVEREETGSTSLAAGIAIVGPPSHASYPGNERRLHAHPRGTNSGRIVRIGGDDQHGVG